MCMNTFGILPDFIRAECVKEMLLCAGPGGKMIIGCWHRDSLRTGYEQFYTKHPELCGVCKESDFDFEKGNFNCSSSDYTSHWWSQEELREMISSVFPGKPEDLKISFEIIGVGIFAICDIAKDATLTRWCNIRLIWWFQTLYMLEIDQYLYFIEWLTPKLNGYLENLSSILPHLINKQILIGTRLFDFFIILSY